MRPAQDTIEPQGQGALHELTGSEYVLVSLQEECANTQMQVCRLADTQMAAMGPWAPYYSENRILGFFHSRSVRSLSCHWPIL